MIYVRAPMVKDPPTTPLCVRDGAIIDERGEAVRLKGVNLEGLDLNLTGLAIGESAATGRDLTTTTEPWAA